LSECLFLNDLSHCTAVHLKMYLKHHVKQRRKYYADEVYKAIIKRLKELEDRVRSELCFINITRLT